MTECACCGEKELMIKDAVIVGDGEDFVYWCKMCVELFNDSVENSL